MKECCTIPAVSDVNFLKDCNAFTSLRCEHYRRSGQGPACVAGTAAAGSDRPGNCQRRKSEEAAAA